MTLKPPAHLTEPERKIWREIANSSRSLLTDTDRMALELLVAILAKQRNRDPLTAGERNSALILLQQLGLTPSARKHMHIAPPVDVKNAFADL